MNVYYIKLHHYLSKMISGSPNSFYFIPVTVDMISNAINVIKLNAIGSDDVNLEMIK